MPFGLLDPTWLGALTLLLPLVWLYLRPRRRPPAVVSSLRIWRRAVAEAPPRPRRPRLPPLLFLQAALIALCSLVLARPYVWEEHALGPPEDAVLVMDLSASMQARDGAGARFERARQAAQERVDAVSGGDPRRRFTIVGAGLRPRVLGSGLSAREAKLVLAGLRPLDTAANLTAAVELAATRAGSAGTVDLFTDLAPGDVVLSRDARGVTAIHRFGRSGANVALVRVETASNPFAGGAGRRVIVHVRSFSEQRREVEVELEPLGGRDGEDLRASATLEPGERRALVFERVPWTGAFVARLAGGDALALDDAIYGFLPELSRFRLLLVSDDARLRRALARLAARIEAIELTAVEASAYRPAEPSTVAVFDGFVPALPPPAPALYLAPRGGNADVAVGSGRVRDAELTDVRGHELLAGLRGLDALARGDLVKLSPGELRPIALARAAGQELPLVLAGERGGRRVVATAFRLPAETLLRADGLSAVLLLLRAVRWLAPAPAGAPILRTTGERLRASLPGRMPIERLEGPDGVRELEPTAELTLERAGVYRAFTAEGEIPVLVSFVDPEESAIGRSAREGLTPAPRRAEGGARPATERRRAPLVAPFLAAVLALMVVEWAALVAGRPEAGVAASAEEG